MVSMLVFAVAFAIGCLSGVVIALWYPNRRGDKSKRLPASWGPMSDSESKTAHHHR